jgi:cbb3-type cytochrome oxidase subunit 1
VDDHVDRNMSGYLEGDEFGISPRKDYHRVRYQLSILMIIATLDINVVFFETEHVLGVPEWYYNADIV